MTRLRWLAAGLLLVGGVAYAESQADIASRENEEGKELMYANKYPDASAKFRDAVARVPEPKYFLNLCASLYQEGKFGEALTACNSGDKNADAGIKEKLDKLSEKIKTDATAQGLDLQPVGGGGSTDTGNPGNPENPGNPDPGNPGNPGNPDPGNPGNPGTPPNGGQQVVYKPVVGRAPEQNLFRAAPPDHSYTWSIGIDFFAGGANFRGMDGNAFGNAAGGVRFKSDVMLNRAAKIGSQGWISITNVTDNGQTIGQHGQLDILDVGAGIYKHICVPGVSRLCLTPLLGASLAFMDPNQTIDSSGMQTFNYLALGIRGELNASFAFGRRYEHVFSALLDVNAYTAAFSDPTDGSPPRDQVGLDAGGAVVYVGVGYTYRFNAPLGRAAFVTLY